MKHRFHFFPAALPDETLHSVLSRYARLYGLGQITPVFASVLGSGSFAHNAPFPCHLTDLVDALPPGTGLSVSEVIERHTLLPYYQPFLSALQVASAKMQMAHQGEEALKLKLGLIASRLENATRIRFCPSCIVHDVEYAGVAYWHRVHQLPGVWVCPDHSEPLIVLDHRKLTRYKQRLLLPDDDGVQSHATLLDISEYHRRALLGIAQLSFEVLQANALPQPADRMRGTLLSDAITLDLASRNGRLHLGPLARYMNAFFQTLPSSGEFSILGNAAAEMPASWVTKILRKPRRTHHPLKFILLASALRIDVSQLLPATDAPPRVVTPESEAPAARTHSCPSCAPSLQSKFAGTAATGVQQPVWARALLGAGAEEIAAEVGVSLASVYRIIRARPDGPSQWKLSRYERERGQRRARFESQYPVCLAHECTDYMWLYRNDRQWLNRRVREAGVHEGKRPHSHPFIKLDPSLAEHILECARSLRALPGKPVHITRSRIGRELDVVSRFEKQLSKLPLCEAALASVCESRESFHQRRLLWANQQLNREGKPVTVSLLYRTASIRPS